jgi:hypothetical protein
MNLSELINEILSEWAYRCDDGMPNPKNPIHLKELGIVLSEMGLSHIKGPLVENLLTEKGKTPDDIEEADSKQFANPILNKSIKYKNAKGEDADGIVGNLLRLPAEHPGRVAAEKMLPTDGSPERDKINQDLGGEGQPKKPDAGKDKGGEDPAAGGEDKAKAAQAMFDPKADPAMAARMDKEKEVQAQLAKDAEADKETEKAQEPKSDTNEFNPIDSKDVAKEMPQADPETFAGGSDIPDGVEPAQLEKFNTDIQNVAQQVADAKAKGEPAPNINLCDVTVPGTNLYCDDNLGIPRDEMPQFKGNASPGSRAAGMEADASGEVDTEPVFREMLQQKGIKTLQTEVPADKLKATQKDLVGAKVVGMMGALEKDPNHPKITAPIYVSRDGYVIDGHHRWAAIVAHNAANPDKQIPMKTTVLDQDIKDAIPMANKFAEDMGIAPKKADANKETPSTPTSVGKNGLTDKVKKKIENWTKEEKAFFEKNEGAPGSETRRSLGQALKDKAAGALKAIKKGAKHEVHIFKDATKGVSKFFAGQDVSEEEVKAIKSVGIKIATTAIFAAGMGGLAAGAAGFAKLVAIELVPHVVAETVLLGAGRAAVFADANGEAEDDANMIKFTELIAKGIEEMEITPEMMEDMVDSYNEKKESGEMDNVETPIEPNVKSEHLHLVDELMLEMIYGFIDEVKPKNDDPDVKYTPIGKNGKPGKPTTIKYSSAIKYDTKHPAYIAAMKLKDKGKKSQTGTTPSAKKLGAGDFRPTADIPSEKPTKKAKAEPKDSTESIAKQKQVTKELYGKGDGPLLQGSTTSQQALDNGYVEGAAWVAPGNAGSNFNENMSNEAVKILEKHPDLDEETLGRIIYERTKNTKLGLQQKDVSIGSENKIAIPADIENKEIYRNCVVVARSAKSKADRAVMGADRATQEGKFGKKRTKQVFGGTKEDLARCEQTINKANKTFIYDSETDSVYEIPKDVMLGWVKSSGGGENAADTATLTLDEKGNVIYDGWSDKKTLKDIQGNSTLVDDYTKSEERLSNLVSTGQIDEKTANKAKLLILKDKQAIKDIEAGLKDISIQQSTYFLSMKPKDFDRLGDDAATTPETKKHFSNFKKSVDDVLSGKAKSGKKTNAIREGILPRNTNESDEQYLARFNKLADKKPKLSNGNYFKVMSSVGKAGMLSGDDRKVIERTANSEKANYKKDGKKLPAGLDTDLALSELRKKSLGIQTDTFKNLNKLTGKSSTGKPKKLGDLLAFDDAKGLLHLDKIDTPKNDKDFTQILRRNTQLAMEGIAVSPKTIKECLGVANTKELEDSFELSFVERYTYDKDNVRVTGKVVYVYAINKDGKKEEIAQKVYRPKQGPTAPTANTVTWSAGMQKCFDSKK